MRLFRSSLPSIILYPSATSFQFPTCNLIERVCNIACACTANSDQVSYIYYITLNQFSEALMKLSPMLNTFFSKHLLLKTRHPFCYKSLKIIRLVLLYVISFPIMSKQSIGTHIGHKLSYRPLSRSPIPRTHRPSKKVHSMKNSLGSWWRPTSKIPMTMK